MTATLWLLNLGSYSLQLALVVTACAAAAALLRARDPRFMLRYWRGVLLVSVLLPALQPWLPAPALTGSAGTAVFDGAARSVGSAHPAWPDAIVASLLLGAVARMVWLGLGLLRLRQYRRRAQTIDLEPAHSLARQLGVAPRVAVSSELAMPVTFGARRPTILLPARLLSSDPARLLAVLCHEMLHVRRRDWRATLGEECVRALLWFHPALAWLLRRIRLTREQLIDREVVALTGNRQAYLEALLDSARAGVRPQPVAALLPKASQLNERIDLLLKEVSMSTKRVRAALGLCVGVLLLSSVVAVRAFPLAAPADSQDDREKPPPPHKPPPKLVYKVDPAFPDDAKAKKVRGREDVVLEVEIAESGAVSDVKVLKGHPAFNESAVEAVKQWKFEPAQPSPARATITIRFVPPPPPPPPPKPQP